MAHGYTNASRVRARKQIDALARRYFARLKADSAQRAAEIAGRVLSLVEGNGRAPHTWR
jgi:hypothetical protein